MGWQIESQDTTTRIRFIGPKEATPQPIDRFDEPWINI
jgi:hypothetical protein